MKKIMIAALVVVAAAVAVDSHAAADDAIKQVFAQLDLCLGGNDAKCVGELFADDATFLAPTGGIKIVKSKAAIVKNLEDAMPSTKSARTHAVVSVRMIGEDHAVVDASEAVVKPAEGDAASAPAAYHTFAVLVLKGDKWIFEDLRSYVVEPPKEPASSSKS